MQEHWIIERHHPGGRRGYEHAARSYIGLEHGRPRFLESPRGAAGFGTYEAALDLVASLRAGENARPENERATYIIISD